MLILQISDFHIEDSETATAGRASAGERLRDVVDAVLALPAQPDLVIGTGDLTQNGSAAAYAQVKAMIAPLPGAFLPVAGNHDERSRLRVAFAESIPFQSDHPFVQYCHDANGVRIVVVDTVTPGSDEPSFCASRAQWLDATLASSNAPTLVVTHHPPFPAGVDWLEPKDPDWAARLRDCLSRAPQVVRLIAGHVHRAVQTRWAGVEASTAPSTAYPVFLDLNGGGPLFSLEPPGFQLHHWNGQSFTTYTASTAGFRSAFRPDA